MLIFVWVYVMSGLHHVSGTLYCCMLVLAYSGFAMQSRATTFALYSYYMLQYASAIIDPETWDAVQKQLAAQAPA